LFYQPLCGWGFSLFGLPAGWKESQRISRPMPAAACKCLTRRNRNQTGFYKRLTPNGNVPMTHKRSFTSKDRNPPPHPLSREGDYLLRKPEAWRLLSGRSNALPNHTLCVSHIIGHLVCRGSGLSDIETSKQASKRHKLDHFNNAVTSCDANRYNRHLKYCARGGQHFTCKRLTFPDRYLRMSGQLLLRNGFYAERSGAVAGGGRGWGRHRSSASMRGLTFKAVL